MENLVINRGNPRRVEIAVLGANGVQVELSRCTDVELVLWINGRSKRAQSVQVANDILIAELSASELDYLGEYSAQVKYTDNGIRSASERVYLFRVANEFYRTASNLSDNGNIAITVTTPQALNKGYSAYELAVQGGFVGTESEWIASLSKESKDAAIIALESAAKADKATSDSIAQTALADKATNRANEVIDEVITQINYAQIATSEANTARDNANTAADNANAKAVIAQNNANLANAAATTANSSAVNADEKAALAVKATTNANTATSNANTATTNANNAATNANAKAVIAQQAADSATNAANYTQGVGDSYEARMVESENKIMYNTLAIEIGTDGVIRAICGPDEIAFTSGQILPNGEIELTFNY